MEQLPSINHLKAIGTFAKANWPEFYEHTKDNAEPHGTLLQAYNLFQAEGKQAGFAIDLGSGTGRDTLFLLKKGWKVLAIDAEELAIEILLNRVDSKLLPNLQVMTNTFSQMILPEDIDLINASYALPFCPPEDFSKVWKHISDSIAIDGRFSGHFLGDRDAWTTIPDRTHLTFEEVQALFEDHFEIEYFNEIKGEYPLANGQMKYWHLFHVVAKKVS